MEMAAQLATAGARSGQSERKYRFIWFAPTSSAVKEGLKPT